MPNLLFQRYDLSAATAATPVGASGTIAGQVVTASIPLSGQWNVRLRWIAGQVNFLDASGMLQIEALGGFWQFQNNGVGFYSLPTGDYMMSPFWKIPIISNFVTQTPVWRAHDTNQVISSFDQLGMVANGVVGVGQCIITNTDAAAAHNFSLQVNAIIEFDDQGST